MKYARTVAPSHVGILLACVCVVAIGENVEELDTTAKQDAFRAWKTFEARRIY